MSNIQPSNSSVSIAHDNDSSQEEKYFESKTASKVASGSMNFTAKDLIRLDKTPMQLPTELITELTKKWNQSFNSIKAANKNIREFTTTLTGSFFNNCHGVKWTAPKLSFDRIERMFCIRSEPDSRQDIMCFNPVCAYHHIICVHAPKLKTVFTQFFEHVNRIRWCSSCGNFSWSHQYSTKLELCEHCIFEEICSSVNEEIHTCAICQEDGRRMFRTNCNHYFHRKCLTKIQPDNIGPRCPLCRAYLDPADQYWAEREMNEIDEDEEPTVISNLNNI